MQNLKLDYLQKKADPLVGFNCTSMINSLLTPQPPAMTRQDTEMIHYCPIQYLSSIRRKGKAATSLGEWEFLRCSETKFFNNCFVTCGLDEAEHYLEFVKGQLHHYYKDPNKIGMNCYCRKSTVLYMSNSEKNPGRLYFKCHRRECKFFQWADVEPRGCVKDCGLEGKPTPGDPRTSSHLAQSRHGYLEQGMDKFLRRSNKGVIDDWIDRKHYKKQSNHFSNERTNKDHVIREHEAQPIPFDQTLWEECQKQEFIVTDSFNIIAVPCELQGKQFLRSKEKELRKELYLLRLIAKINKEASEQSQKEH